jgi:hypothetical protein
MKEITSTAAIKITTTPLIQVGTFSASNSDKT